MKPLPTSPKERSRKQPDEWKVNNFLRSFFDQQLYFK